MENGTKLEKVMSKKIAGLCIICKKPVYFLEGHEDVGHFDLLDNAGTLTFDCGYGSGYDLAYAVKPYKGDETVSRDLALCNCDKVMTFIHDKCFKYNNQFFLGVDIQTERKIEIIMPLEE